MPSYQEEFRIRYSDCDRFRKLKLHAVFDYAQEIAGNHADLLGFGNQMRTERHLAWILSRMKLKIKEYPTSEDKVQVLTWPSGYNRIFATREYRFFTGKEHRIFAEASSYWALLNFETMRVAIPQRELADCNMGEGNDERIYSDLEKLTVDAQAPVLGEFNIYEHQIDLNGHLNNTEYASLVQDTLGVGCYPAELQINYLKAVMPQSVVQIRGSKTDQDFILVGKVGDVEAFHVAGTLMPQKIKEPRE